MQRTKPEVEAQNLTVHVHVGVDGMFEKLEETLLDFDELAIPHVALAPRKAFRRHFREALNRGQKIDLTSFLLSHAHNSGKVALLIPRFLDVGSPLNQFTPYHVVEKLIRLLDAMSGLDVKVHLLLGSHETYLYSHLARGRSLELRNGENFSWTSLLDAVEIAVADRAELRVWKEKSEDLTALSFLTEVCEIQRVEALRVCRTLTTEFVHQTSTSDITRLVQKAFTLTSSQQP